MPPPFAHQVKTVEIKKSQLFEDFHQAMLSKVAGRSESYVLEVWDHKEKVKTKWKSRGEYYSGRGPIATLGYRNLTEVPDAAKEYHLSEKDVINDVVYHTDKSESEVTERDITMNLEATNEDLLRDLWNRRNDKVKQLGPYAFENSSYDEIEIKWDDDTTAEEFLKKKFDFY